MTLGNLCANNTYAKFGHFCRQMPCADNIYAGRDILVRATPINKKEQMWSFLDAMKETGSILQKYLCRLECIVGARLRCAY